MRFYEGLQVKFILEEMEKYKIKSVMWTNIYMFRKKLITKEKVKKFCKGEYDVKDSVNDDLETLFKDLRRGKTPKKLVDTYFLPKLTEEELKLVERRDTSYLQSLVLRVFLEEAEMENKKSESDSRFILGYARRKTFTIANGSFQKNSNCCDLQ